MRAAQIRTVGEPGIVLELADLPEPPAPAAGQVLIGVEHAPINLNDLYLTQGLYPVRPSLPSVVGNEGLGRVLAIGTGVDVALATSATVSRSFSMVAIWPNGGEWMPCTMRGTNSCSGMESAKPPASASGSLAASIPLFAASRVASARTAMAHPTIT